MKRLVPVIVRIARSPARAAARGRADVDRQHQRQRLRQEARGSGRGSRRHARSRLHAGLRPRRLEYVLVVDGKVFQIANQDNKDLATHAGHHVKVTGELKGNAITVSKIEMSAS